MHFNSLFQHSGGDTLGAYGHRPVICREQSIESEIDNRGGACPALVVPAIESQYIDAIQLELSYNFKMGQWTDAVNEYDYDATSCYLQRALHTFASCDQSATEIPGRLGKVGKATSGP
jgi:hypothetical protein